MTSPTTRVTRPRREMRGRSPIRAASRLRSIDLCHAAVGALERGIDATVDDAVAAFDETTASRHAWIGQPACIACAADRAHRVRAAADRQDGQVERMYPDANALVDRKLGQCAAYEVGDELALEADFTPDD